MLTYPRGYFRDWKNQKKKKKNLKEGFKFYNDYLNEKKKF